VDELLSGFRVVKDRETAPENEPILYICMRWAVFQAMTWTLHKHVIFRSYGAALTILAAIPVKRPDLRAERLDQSCRASRLGLDRSRE
jgi:hypothetical protein